MSTTVKETNISKIVNYLISKEQQPDYKFTQTTLTAELVELFGDEIKTSISPNIDTLFKKKMLTREKVAGEKNRQVWQYQIAKTIADYNLNNGTKQAAESKVTPLKAQNKPKLVKPATALTVRTRQQIISSIISELALLQSMEPDLSSISDEQLLAETARRMGVQQLSKKSA